MPKITVFMMISVDGFFEGLDHDITWHNVDDEFNDFAAKQLDEAGMLLFGHRTYDLMAGYWPNPEVLQDDPIIASKMNTMPKLVFSTHEFTPEWQNTRLISADIPSQLQKLANEPGGDLLVLGSSNLCVSLLEMKLLNEVRVIVNPVIIGQGTQLFHGLKKPLKIDLTDTRQFKSGNILNIYQVNS